MPFGSFKIKFSGICIFLDDQRFCDFIFLMVSSTAFILNIYSSKSVYRPTVSPLFYKQQLNIIFS